MPQIWTDKSQRRATVTSSCRHEPDHAKFPIPKFYRGLRCPVKMKVFISKRGLMEGIDAKMLCLVKKEVYPQNGSNLSAKVLGN